MNVMIKHLALRAKSKMESCTSLTEVPVMQVPAPVLVQMVDDIEHRENHIVELSLESFEMRQRAIIADRRVEALAKLAKHYGATEEEIQKYIQEIK